MIKKRYMSLLEIMIVILLIGVITSVVGFNVKGSLEKGKVFKTRQAIVQIRDLLLLEVANGTTMASVIGDPVTALTNSGVPRDAENFIRDGWNELFTIVATRNNTDISVTSRRLDNYDARIRRNTPSEQEATNDTEELPY